MKFLEHKAKEVFIRYGIPVPRGVVVSSPDDLTDPPLPCVVKAQVLVGGRGKAGGIRFASTLEETRAAASDILGMTIHGHAVREVLVAERLDIEKELYLSLTIDRSAREPLLMASGMGGVDIESVPRDRIVMEHVPTMIGIQPYLLRTLRSELNLSKEPGDLVADIVRRAWALFRAEDAELVEINPLALTRDGRVLAADAKLVVDDNAGYRHPDYAAMDQGRTPLEEEAHEKGIAFIQLDGDVGVIANGAGLTMATLDVLHLKGGRGGAFLDLGGTDDPKRVQEAFSILLKARPSVVLLNIFGGITKADTVAQGVKEALEAAGSQVPVVARIKGVNEDRAHDILMGIGAHAADTIEDATDLAVKVRSGGA
jgi:succinyl-CoA synthetase beta subunit